ncbi:MAG: flavin reductase family protein [Candidatus Bathyarchaeia archaeon]|jgi:flavin reductase (DIM6/NTAB) family NADH-FMN oxidoreductase RutF
MDEFPISKAFQFLEPGPVVLLTTADKGKFNVMTMSWHLVMDFTPLIGCIVGPWDYSFRALKETKECVISIPTVDLASKVVDIGNCSGKDTDKFKTFNLTPLPAKTVGAPLIAECLANIECKVIDTIIVDKYDFFILRGVQAWVDSTRKERQTFHAKGDGTFVVDGTVLDLKQKMTKWQDTL